MQTPLSSHSRAVAPRPVSRRALLKGLVAAPVCLGLSRAFAAEVTSGTASSPAKLGPRGRTLRVDGEMKEYRDQETGARVMQLTGDGSDNVHLYFTSESFVDGSERIVFGSNRTGKFQHYLLEIREKRLTQLTDGADVHPTKACLARGGQLFYFDGPLLRSLKIDTLEDHDIYRVPDGFDPHLPTCTAKGDFVAFGYKEKRAVSTRSGVIYSDMAETYHQHPSSVIMRINTANGQPAAVWGEHEWISHVLINPVNPDQILFCHEGGGLVTQRMFMVNVSPNTLRKVTPTPLYPMRAGEFTVHEYFTRGGEVGFQYEVERDGKMEYYNACIRTDGTWIRQYLLPGPRPGHIQSNTDNTLIVGDRGFLSPDDKAGGNYMSLMTHNNGRESVRRLCRYQPGPTQFSHGHPVFSLDDKWVIFNSRLGTKENIAMAEVGSI
jgi:oligogalacturonide lyase